MIDVKGPADMPKGAHFAIIVFETASVFIPGDERSRTCPGHGYPERTESYSTFRYLATEDRTEWEEQVKRAADSREPYVAISVSGKAKIERKVVVTIPQEPQRIQTHD